VTKGSNGREEVRIVERLTVPARVQLGHGDTALASFEHGKRGLLALAATQIDPDEAREWFAYGRC
jgi:hypothetical protein